MVFCILHAFSTASGSHLVTDDRPELKYYHEYRDLPSLKIQRGPAGGGFASNSLDNSEDEAGDDQTSHGDEYGEPLRYHGKYPINPHDARPQESLEPEEPSSWYPYLAGLGGLRKSASEWWGNTAPSAIESVGATAASERDRCLALFKKQYGPNQAWAPWMKRNHSRLSSNLKFAKEEPDKVQKFYDEHKDRTSLYAPDPAEFTNSGQFDGITQNRVRFIFCSRWRNKSNFNWLQTAVSTVALGTGVMTAEMDTCTSGDPWEVEQRREICPFDCPAPRTSNCGLSTHFTQNEFFLESLTELGVKRTVKKSRRSRQQKKDTY